MSRAYSFMHRVTFEETNLVGNVYFVNYVRWQGHCREHFLIDHAPNVIAELRSGELALVTAAVHVDFIGESFAGDQIVINMSQGLGGPGGGRVAMNFTYERSGSLIATGRQSVACMRRTTAGVLQPVAVPGELQAALDRFRS